MRDLRHALLTVSQGIGRQLRDLENPLSYPHALELLADLEDKLQEYALTLPEQSTLSGNPPTGYLPSRHPAKVLANTLAGSAARVHPALRAVRQPSPYPDKSLRPTSQTEDFSE